MAGKIPIKEVEAMLREGLSQTQVVRILARQGIEVTQGAISQAVSSGRINVESNVSTGAIPWTLRPEHRNAHHAKMLRTQARLDKGLEVGPSLRRQVEAWRASLERDNAVIHYDPETPEGFWRFARREGVDGWWVREPSLDDQGRPVVRRIG